jgi:hypothetical protein
MSYVRWLGDVRGRTEHEWHQGGWPEVEALGAGGGDASTLKEVEQVFLARLPERKPV